MEAILQEEIDILLIEDDPNDADLILRSLRKQGMDLTIRHVEDGAAALAVLDAQGGAEFKIPKLIILDLSMPKVDGAEVLETIKNNEQTRRIPVVVLTSSMEDRDLKKCYDLGVNSYVVKPVDFTEFSKTISNIGRYWIDLNMMPR